MKINFTKMHGCGNDYIFIDCTKDESMIKQPERLARIMSKRHFSVGSDGLVLILRSKTCDFKMRIFNSDGSEGSICGNALRCVGKLVFENRLTERKQLLIETKSGPRQVFPDVRGGKVFLVTVGMGKAETDPIKLGMRSDTPKINAPIRIAGNEYRITAVSVGNSHQVIFLNDPDRLELAKLGREFESNPLFFDRVNTEFVKVIKRNELYMRVYERGSGETYACGSGACAAAFAAVLNGHCDFNLPIRVGLVGGFLEITVKDDRQIIMTGPAERVYEGVFEYLEDEDIN